MSRRVLVSAPQMQARLSDYMSTFERLSIEIEAPTIEQRLSEEQLLRVIDRFEGVIAGDDHFTEQVLRRASQLKIISKWGVGLDNIDLAAAQRMNIKVSNTPGAFNADVADVCLGYIILLARGLHIIDEKVSNGLWYKIEGTSLQGKTLGIVGLGGIGRALAQRALVHEMVVLGTENDERSAAEATKLGVEITTLQQLLRRSHFVSLNCSLTETNRHMLGQEEFQSMRSGSWLVNTARGALIDESAMVQALQDGRLRGVALDVFETEPLPKDSALRRFPQCIFGSHNASNTREAVDRTSAQAVDNLVLGLQGHP